MDLCAARCGRAVADAVFQRTGIRYKTRTAAITGASFGDPLYAGDMMHVVGRVVHGGGSSIGVSLQCAGGEAFVTLALVGGGGRLARAVPAVELADPADIERHHAYEASRRAPRLTAAEALDAPSAAKPQHVRMRDTVCRANNTFLRCHLNSQGTVFGGALLSYMERYAVHCGRVFAQRRHVYTAGVPRVDFCAPVLPTDYVALEAKVIYVGDTTMEVDVILRAERGAAQPHVVTNQGSFILVCQDGQHRNVSVPRGIDVAAATPEELQQYAAACERHRRRREVARRCAAA
ncbi:ATP-binding protein Cassette (ABC) superfamily [Strigomonas culicis]|uniref:ATP-binding protein Cassette (ABC) superfamily n=1 Tax=Strigomonas culicis TaxID=28005 RepID=S9VW32_9TRYP|nr:ATP-binding protein Cassette (ABC) superfamily [Strigomonas culicis]|eukprot:EPY31236.1 ATP-binding protein Cassette (ABC) superfamily [Strigomonas culicis]